MKRVEMQITSGCKYQIVTHDVVWQLLNDFTITRNFETRYYSITTDGLFTFKVSCCYNGPNAFPDVDWMMIGSLIHDGLDWLIGKGIIPESENWLIDKELGDIVKLSEPPQIITERIGKAWRSFRSWYIRVATGFDSQKVVATQKPIRIFVIMRPD